MTVCYVADILKMTLVTNAHSEFPEHEILLSQQQAKHGQLKHPVLPASPCFSVQFLSPLLGYHCQDFKKSIGFPNQEGISFFYFFSIFNLFACVYSCSIFWLLTAEGFQLIQCFSNRRFISPLAQSPDCSNSVYHYFG